MGVRDTEWIRTLAPDARIASSPPQCLQETLTRASDVLGTTATAWAIQTASAAARGALSHPAGREVPDVELRPVRRVSESCILTFLTGLVADLPADRLLVPDEAREAVLDTVHAGIPLERVLRTMWSAHMATLDALLSHLAAQSAHRVSGRADVTLWSREERRVRQWSFAYLEAFSDWLTQEYLAERDAWAGSLSAARRAIVADILGGRRIVARDAEATLGVRLTDRHLALIIWAGAENADGVLDSHLMSTATSMAAAVQATTTLTVHGAPGSLWTWLGWRQQPDPALIRKLNAIVAPPRGVRVAIGSPGSGTAGFRRSHQQAQEAQRVSPVTAGPFCYHSDIALLALLTTNAEHASWFVQDTLGRLAEDGTRISELRATLHAYLSGGRSRAAAAGKLHIASGTVAYRLRQAEALLGSPVRGTGRDIQLAIEMLPVLPPHRDQLTG